MKNQRECEALARLFISQLDEKSIYRGAEFFNTLHRYSGSEDGERAVDYIMEKSDDIIIRIFGGLTRLVYTSGSPYSQDEAVSRGLFPVLSDAGGQTPENTTPEYYLALCTAFKRQTNRIEGEILRLLEFIDVETSKRKGC